MGGKCVRDTKYVHVSNMRALSEPERLCLKRAEVLAKVQRGRDYNVAKITAKEERVSLLLYSAFFDDPFPALQTAWSSDLAAGTVRQRSYKNSANPPILHRKELLLERGHPRRSEYQALTQAAESAGLLDQPATIGFKRQWHRRLQQAGLRLEGHRLISATEEVG